MSIANELRIEILYGAGDLVAIDRRARAPLRLNTMPWAFPEEPDLKALGERGQRLGFLRDQLKSLCPLWDKLPRLFLDAYFRHIVECIAENRAALEATADRLGGLFAPEDWSYSALCPLPRARLPANTDPPVDFVFWTGETLCAVAMTGTETPNRTRREGLRRLRESGIAVIEISGADLRHDGSRILLARLPAPFHEFWKSERLPTSPFRIGALDEILRA
jgi:hypothetical protein